MRKSWCGLLGLTLSAFGHAQQFLETDPVVVTATRIPQPLSRSLHPVQVITEQEIEASGQQTLVQLLQARGGVEVSQNGGFGQLSSVFLRGANSAHTLVLIDGLRVNSATAGTTRFEHIPLDQVERIEIAPGPFSSLYGSDAVGGVIQIFTKSGRLTPGPSASVGYGRYDIRSASAGWGHAFGDTDLRIDLGYFETNGFDVTKPTARFGIHNPDTDPYRDRNGSAKIAHTFAPQQEAGITFFHSEGKTHFDSGPTTNDINETTLNAYSVYSRNRITSNWESLLRLGRGRDDSDVRGSSRSAFRTTQDQVNWQNDIRLRLGTLIAGAEYREEEVESSTAFLKSSRDIAAGFAGYNVEVGKHLAQLNLRHDDYSDFGGHTTGSAGYGYLVSPSIKLRASAGTAFHAPTFNDLYFPASLFCTPCSNPNLDPERSRSWEVGADYLGQKHRVNLTYFENRIKDLIVFVFDPVTFLSAPENVDRARIRGVQLLYSGDLVGLEWLAQATFQEPEDQETGKLLPRRAEKYGRIGVGRGFGALKLAAEVVASAERFDQPQEAPGSRMAGYGLLNLIASYALARDWSVIARWDNVLDKEYELAQGFNTARSNVFVSLQYSPKR